MDSKFFIEYEEYFDECKTENKTDSVQAYYLLGQISILSKLGYISTDEFRKLLKRLDKDFDYDKKKFID